MSTQEINNCSFCNNLKPVLRKYIHAKYRFKEGKEFNSPVIICYCENCGIDEPTVRKPNVGNENFTTGNTLDM